MQRKTFLKLLIASAATGTALTFIESCTKTSTSPQGVSANFTLDLTSSTNSALLTSGGYLVSNQVIVINNNGTYIALSDICTHQGCPLVYTSSNSELLCNCHGSTFNTAGSVLGGLASAPLKVYTVTHTGNNLHVQG